MGDRLIIYGSGSDILGRYVAKKDISTAAIAQLVGGVRVDWGGGDIVTLSGSIWTEQKTIYGGWFVRGLVAGSWTNCSSYNSELWLIQGGGWAAKTIHPPYPATSENWNITNAEKDPNKSFSAIFAGNQSNCGTSSTWNIRDSQNIFYVYLSFRKSTPSFHLATREKIRITTNTGDFSERGSHLVGASTPVISLVPGGCAIAITFADGTSRQIPVNPCPTWVQKKPENACPDGTVHQCDHGATTCCYGCEDGRLVLLDTFNKTS